MKKAWIAVIAPPAVVLFVALRRTGDASVELAASATVRLQDDYVLADTGNSSPEQDSVRELGRKRGTAAFAAQR